MLLELCDLMVQPESYDCVWRDGELYIEPVVASEPDLLIAA